MRSGALRMLATGLSSLLISTEPGFADRHCFPAQDAYFAARYLLQEDGQNCDPALAAARDELDAAVAQAGICGCTALIEKLEQLRRIAGDEDRSCENRRAALLNAETQVEETVRDCHY